ncbi:MAG: LamG-like jellyroll fold domain-containing protein, partial [bacterium]
ISPNGTFTVFNSQCHNNAHIVVTHPALTNLTDSILSNWSCSTHEVFDSWPSDFVVLAIGRNLGAYLAIDGSVGQPYILVRGEGFTSTNCVNAPTGLVNWWDLDELSGPNAADLRETPNNGLHVGGPTPVSGKVQGGLQFDGINDQVDVVDATEVNFGTGDFSIDAWIKTTASSGTVALVDKIDAGGNIGYSMMLQNGILGIELADGSSTTYLSGSFVADGAWHLVAIIVDRSSNVGITFFIDGFAVSTADPTLHPGSLTNTNQLVLGARSASGSDRYTGILDEVEMFDRALTSFDVFTLLLADSLGKCSLDVVVGACCLPPPYFGCFLTLGQEECDSLGGFYLGDSTTCDSNICDQYALGVCCMPDGSCMDSLSYDDCVYAFGGLFQGAGTNCATTDCLPQGACCISDGNGSPDPHGNTCIMTMGQVACENMGGTYHGDGSICDTIPCDTCNCLGIGDLNGDGDPLTEIDLEILTGIVYGWIPPIDSMCHADLNGDCIVDQTDIDLLQCYLTYGFSCFTSLGGYPVSTCCDPSTVTGACCMLDNCYQYAMQNCIEGSYQGDSTLCDTINCNPDTLIIIDTVIIIIISWPPIDIDTIGPIDIGPFDPGPIGVAFVMHDTATISWGGKWNELEQPGAILPVGAFMQFKAYQRMPGAADQSIGTGKAHKLISGQWQLEADFTSIGATKQSVEVFSNDQIVATLQEHSGPAGTATRPPDDWHWSTHPPNGARIQHGCTGSWSVPVEIELAHSSREGMHHVMADSVKFIPENQTVPTNYLSKIILSAKGIPSISFTGWTIDAESCCEVRGDVAFPKDGSVLVNDLVWLVNYLFKGGSAPTCLEEGDAAVPTDGNILVNDLVWLVNYLFKGGLAPSPC